MAYLEVRALAGRTNRDFFPSITMCTISILLCLSRERKEEEEEEEEEEERERGKLER